MSIISGPSNSGKSKIAEQMFKQFSKKIYLGTLPHVEKFKERIKKHKRRREGESWITVEYDESKCIDEQIKNYNEAKVLLIDGIQPLIARLSIALYSKDNDILEFVSGVSNYAFHQIECLTNFFDHIILVMSNNYIYDKSYLGQKIAANQFWSNFFGRYSNINSFQTKSGVSIIMGSGNVELLDNINQILIRKKSYLFEQGRF